MAGWRDGNIEGWGDGGIAEWWGGGMAGWRDMKQILEAKSRDWQSLFSVEFANHTTVFSPEAKTKFS